MASRLEGLPLVEPGSREEWRSWLEEHHSSSTGVWLAIGKKGGSATCLTYDEAVEESLAFGWIDSVTRRMDDHRFKQLMTPRKRGSIWANSNKKRIERLTAEGKMAPAGLAVVEAAQADGSWNALDEAESLVIPDDLAAALAADPEAERNYSAFSESTRKIILYRVWEAKRPETRAKRIAAVVDAARDGRPPW
ncbi:MAG TPA: YdeI/OmpD-associated family protein [Coriobacteriia bacterium]|nr:YdeI/OmpD-associated family protein [Coriobacteriia bacterium]